MHAAYSMGTQQISTSYEIDFPDANFLQETKDSQKDPFNGFLLVISPNTGKYGPEITPYLNTVHAVLPGPFFPSLYIKDEVLDYEFLF